MAKEENPALEQALKDFAELTGKQPQDAETDALYLGLNQAGFDNPEFMVEWDNHDLRTTPKIIR
jgi:hypothetical protein